MKTHNRTNYDDWRESMDMYLVITKEDLDLREAKLTDVTVESSAANRAYHKQWLTPT